MRSKSVKNLRFQVQWAIPFLTSIVLLLCSCSSGTRTARDVQLRQHERERSFLYKEMTDQHLSVLAGKESIEQTDRTFYVWNREDQKLEAVKGSGKSVGAEEAMFAIGSSEDGPRLHFWNWLTDESETNSFSLSSLSVRTADVDRKTGQKTYKVVFSAHEPALFPFSSESDVELFRAKLTRKEKTDSFQLKEVRQLTFNARDDREPSFSPNGRWIVYTHDVAGSQQVFLMDDRGRSVRSLTRHKQGSAYHPVVLPNNRRCLYVRDLGGTASFYSCNLKGKGHTKASDDELRQRLFSWDDQTRHLYLKTEVFAHQSNRLLTKVPREMDLKDLLLLMEWNAPELSSYREQILFARAERRLNQKENSGTLEAKVTDVVKVGALVDEPATNPGDRSSEDLTRYLLSLKVPVMTGSLKKAITQRDRWKVAAYTQTYRKRYAEKSRNLVKTYYEYSKQKQRTKMLRRILDLNRKRKFLIKHRVDEGRSTREKLLDAKAKVKDVTSRLSKAKGAVKSARAKLLSAAGLNPNNTSVTIHAAPLHGKHLPRRLPDKRRMQGLVQLNHPELNRLKFLELRAAAIRDMGPPEHRQPPTIGVSYGVGVENFFGQVVDDFISTTLGHAWSLTHTGQKTNYVQKWTHEMKRFRAERRQLRLDLIAGLTETRRTLAGLKKELETAKSRRKHAAEQVRRHRIYRSGIPRPGWSEAYRSPTALIQKQIELQEHRMEVVETRAQYFQNSSSYFYHAGRMRHFLQFLDQNETVQPQTDSEREGKRSVYLWESLRLVRSPEMRKTFLQICQEQGIDRVYVHLSRVNGRSYLEDFGWEFGYFLKRLDEHQIDAYALVNNPNWLKSASRDQMDHQLQHLFEFNNREQIDQVGFEGVQISIKPHEREGWNDPERRDELMEQYLDMVSNIRRRIDQDPVQSLSLAVTIPHSWESLGRKRFLNPLLKTVDGVSVRSSFTNGATIARKAAPLVRQATSLRVPVEVVIDMQKGPGKKRLFANQSTDALLRELDRAYGRLREHSMFQGFSLHDYRGVKSLFGRNDVH